MEPEKRTAVFSRVVFMLNASFPQQTDGTPLYAQWKSCETLFQQVSSLLAAYEWVTDLGFPLVLGEIAVRCAW